jgi:hypothetical protein
MHISNNAQKSVSHTTGNQQNISIFFSREIKKYFKSNLNVEQLYFDFFAQADFSDHCGGRGSLKGQWGAIAAAAAAFKRRKKA